MWFSWSVTNVRVLYESSSNIYAFIKKYSIYLTNLAFCTTLKADSFFAFESRSKRALCDKSFVSEQTVIWDCILFNNNNKKTSKNYYSILKLILMRGTVAFFLNFIHFRKQFFRNWRFIYFHRINVKYLQKKSCNKYITDTW